MPGDHVWFLILSFECHWIILHQITSHSTKTNKSIYFEYVAWIILKKCWCFWCAIIKMTNVLCWVKLYNPPPPFFASSEYLISQWPLTHASFSPFSLFLSLPPMLASSIFFPLRLFPSSETMVKDNIYRKPPIYKQHGTVYFLVNTSFSGLVSARCVACRLSVMSSSIYPSSPCFSSKACTRLVDSHRSTCVGLVLEYCSHSVL